MNILSLIQPSELGPDFRLEEGVWKVNFPTSAAPPPPISNDARNTVTNTPEGMFIDKRDRLAYALVQDSVAQKIRLYEYPADEVFTIGTAALVSDIDMLGLNGQFDDVAIDEAVITFTDVQTGLTLTLNTIELQRVGNIQSTNGVSVTETAGVLSLTTKIDPNVNNMLEVGASGLKVNPDKLQVGFGEKLLQAGINTQAISRSYFANKINYTIGDQVLELPKFVMVGSTGEVLTLLNDPDAMDITRPKVIENIPANTDTMYFKGHPAWYEPLYNIEVNGVVHDMSGCLALDSGTHFIIDRDDKYGPKPSPMNFPAALGALVNVNYLPESGDLLFRNKTDQTLKIKLIPLKRDLPISHDGKNLSAVISETGTFNFELTPKLPNNPLVDDLVYSAGFPNGDAEGNYIMLGIAYNYEYLHSPDDYIEVETVLDVDPDSTSHNYTTILGENGNKIYRCNLHTDTGHYNPNIKGTAYIWYEFPVSAAIPIADIRIRASRPIHQLEMWEAIEVKQWGRYMVDQPYCVGNTISSTQALTKLGEKSPFTPGSIIIEGLYAENQNIDIYSFVKNGGGGWIDSFDDANKDLYKHDYFDNKATTINGAKPILVDTSIGSDFVSRVIPEDLDKLVFKFKAHEGSGLGLKMMAAVYAAGKHVGKNKQWVGNRKANSTDLLEYSYDAVSGESIFTLDVAAFKVWDSFVPYVGVVTNTFRDLRLLFKRRWGKLQAGKIDLNIQGFKEGIIEPTYNYSHTYDSTLFSKKDNVWSDFLVITDQLYLDGVAPATLETLKLGMLTKKPLPHSGEVEYSGVPGAVIGVTYSQGNRDVPVNLGDKVVNVSRYPYRSGIEYYTLGWDGTLKLPYPFDYSNSGDVQYAWNIRASLSEDQIVVKPQEKQLMVQAYQSTIDPSLTISSEELKPIAEYDVTLPSDTYLLLEEYSKEGFLQVMDAIESFSINASVRQLADAKMTSLKSSVLDMTPVFKRAMNHIRNTPEIDILALEDYYVYSEQFTGDDYLTLEGSIKTYVDNFIEMYKKLKGFGDYNLSLKILDLRLSFQVWEESPIYGGDPLDVKNIIYLVFEPTMVLETDRPIPALVPGVSRTFLNYKVRPEDGLINFNTYSGAVESPPYPNYYFAFGGEDVYSYDPWMLVSKYNLVQEDLILIEGNNSALGPTLVHYGDDSEGNSTLFLEGQYPKDLRIKQNIVNPVFHGDTNIVSILDAYSEHSGVYVVNSQAVS